MKLKQNVNNQVDLNEIIENLKLQYKNLYLFQFEDQVFIYRSIGRKEYKDIVLNENLTDQEKEEKPDFLPNLPIRLKKIPIFLNKIERRY